MLIHFREYRSPSACRSEWKHVGTWNQTSSDPKCRAGFELQLQEFYHPLQQVGPAGNNVGWIIIFLYPHQPIPLQPLQIIHLWVMPKNRSVIDADLFQTNPLQLNMTHGMKTMPTILHMMTGLRICFLVSKMQWFSLSERMPGSTILCPGFHFLLLL